MRRWQWLFKYYGISLPGDKMKNNEQQPLRYHFVSIDDECEKWAPFSHDNNSPPCFTILRQFYDELMIPTFPLEEERDDLDDWFECFRFQIKQICWKEQGMLDVSTQELSDDEKLLLQGNAMDVILMVVMDDNLTSKEYDATTTKTAPRRQLDHRMSSFAGLYAPKSTETDPTDVKKPLIIGAAAVEYYKESRVGLLSYIVLHSDFRGRGFASLLHKEALSRLARLSSLYGSPKVEGSDAPLVQAVFAETNTAAADDVTPEQSLLRHKSLYKLGYRLVNFPYAQPPLCTKDVDASFDDLLLLVYFPFEEEILVNGTENSSEYDAENFYSWYQSTSPVMMDVNIPFCYVEDFYKSVFGYNSAEEHSLANRDDVDGIPDYRTAKYFKLADWFSRNRCNLGLVEVDLCGPPWDDCKEALYLEMEESQQKR
jgi:GNAT superfamily N-acetyltransferase